GSSRGRAVRSTKLLPSAPCLPPEAATTAGRASGSRTRPPSAPRGQPAEDAPRPRRPGALRRVGGVGFDGPPCGTVLGQIPGAPCRLEADGQRVLGHGRG